MSTFEVGDRVSLVYNLRSVRGTVTRVHAGGYLRVRFEFSVGPDFDFCHESQLTRLSPLELLLEQMPELPEALEQK